ncbi:hypothetical protein [Lentzea sp. E54]|uniref:hypothetical protein n=1 Tax=Lentzea xerophila TaxID=3435883 RepID=UPI003DA40F8B
MTSMGNPTAEDSTCLICAGEYDSGAHRPVQPDTTCGTQICLSCLENLLRHSCVPTPVPTAGDDEGEWGLLPAGVNCPFCRADLDRRRLEELQIDPELLTRSFDADRSRAYHRYPGEDWQAFEDTSFSSVVLALPVLDDGRLSAAYGDRWFMPETGCRVTQLVEAYHDELREIRVLVEDGGELTPGQSGTAIVRFDGITLHLFAICADRADVVNRFLAALLAPAEHWQSSRANLDAMMAACAELQAATSDSLRSASELLEATPCVELVVPDLGPVQNVLGQQTQWFEFAATITRTNETIARHWSTLQQRLDHWSLEEARTLSGDVLAAIDRMEVAQLISVMDDLTLMCAMIREESAYVLGQVAAIRHDLELSELNRM